MKTKQFSTSQSLSCFTFATGLTLLSGCGVALKEGAQHAHFLPNEALEVHTAIQLEMLPEPLHAKACADIKTMYDVTVMGTTKSLSRGERAAALEALNQLGGTADVFYLTRSYGSLDTAGNQCGEVWGRGIRLRTRDFTPATVAIGSALPTSSLLSTVPVQPTPETPSQDKKTMGF